MSAQSEQSDSDYRGSELGTEAAALAEHIYHGNMDDEGEIRDAVVSLVQRGIALGYELGRRS